MTLTIRFPEHTYTIIVNPLPKEGETVPLVRGLSLTRRNGVLHIEGMVTPIEPPTLSLLEMA